MSTQSTSYQQEAANRLHLPFALLLDQQLKMTHALRLPTFEVQGWTLIKRLMIVIHQGKIEKVFYPVFAPDKQGEELPACGNQFLQGRCTLPIFTSTLNS